VPLHITIGHLQPLQGLEYGSAGRLILHETVAECNVKHHTHDILQFDSNVSFFPSVKRKNF